MIPLLKKHFFLLIVAAVGILVLVLPRDSDEQLISEEGVTPISAESDHTTADVPAEEEQSLIMVDVKGEVHSPGVYKAESGMRVHEVIDQAGGFTKEANEAAVNLAQKVHDEMVIFIPHLEEDGTGAAGTAIQDDKVRINVAEQADIETLPGIGPSKAAAIIAHREEHGLFKTVDDLLKVSGIGEKTLDNIKDALQVP